MSEEFSALGFLGSVGVLSGIVFIAKGILVIFKSFVRDLKPDKAKNTDPVLMSHYWDLERDILTHCYNEKTHVFDWNTWFDRRDEIIHFAPEAILADIDSNFRHYGKLQIYDINAIINAYCLNVTPFDPSEGIRVLRRDIGNTGILINLPSMYSSVNAEHNTEICPEEVREYQSLLSDILNGRISASRYLFERIVQLGNDITNRY